MPPAPSLLKRAKELRDRIDRHINAADYPVTKQVALAELARIVRAVNHRAPVTKAYKDAQVRFRFKYRVLVRDLRRVKAFWELADIPKTGPIPPKLIAEFRAAFDRTASYAEDLGIKWTPKSIAALLEPDSRATDWALTQIGRERGLGRHATFDLLYRRRRWHRLVP